MSSSSTMLLTKKQLSFRVTLLHLFDSNFIQQGQTFTYKGISAVVNANGEFEWLGDDNTMKRSHVPTNFTKTVSGPIGPSGWPFIFTEEGEKLEDIKRRYLDYFMKLKNKKAALSHFKKLQKESTRFERGKRTYKKKKSSTAASQKKRGRTTLKYLESEGESEEESESEEEHEEEKGFDNDEQRQNESEASSDDAEKETRVDRKRKYRKKLDGSLMDKDEIGGKGTGTSDADVSQTSSLPFVRDSDEEEAEEEEEKMPQKKRRRSVNRRRSRHLEPSSDDEQQEKQQKKMREQFMIDYSASPIEQLRSQMRNYICVREKQPNLTAKDLAPSVMYDIAFHAEGSYLFSSQSILANRSLHFQQLIKEMREEIHSAFIELELPVVEAISTVSVFTRVLEFCVTGSIVNFDFVNETADLYIYCSVLKFGEMVRFILELVVQMAIDRNIRINQTIQAIAALRSLNANSSKETRNSVQMSLRSIVEGKNSAFFASYPPLEETDQEYSSVLSDDNLPYSESELFLNVILFRAAFILLHPPKTTDTMDTRITVGKALGDSDKESRQVLMYAHAGLTLRCYSTDKKVTIANQLLPLVVFEVYNGDTILGQVTNEYMRENLNTILPKIRFELVSLKDIFETMEPTQILTHDELFSFLKAGYLREQNRPYQILNINVSEKPRSARRGLATLQ